MSAIPIEEEDDDLKPDSFSVSRVETAEACTRKWVGEKVLELPLKAQGSQSFGTILHTQVENVLLGLPTFQSGWAIPKPEKRKQQGAPLDAHESDLVRNLVKAGIDHGIIAPLPEMQVEHAFEFELPEQLGKFTGKIDVLYLHGVQDHKTTSSMKYAVKGDGLKNNLQMLTYAKVFFMRYPQALTCEVRHNIFCKGNVDRDEPPLVTQSESVVLSRMDVERVWLQRTLPIIRRMASFLGATEADWFKIPGPHILGTCSKYKSKKNPDGCPFSRICTRMETIDQYRNRVLAFGEPKNEPVIQETTTRPMNKFAKMVGKGTTATLPAPKVLPTVSLPAEPTPAPVASELIHVAGVASGPTTAVMPAVIEKLVAAPIQPGEQIMPWANPDCTNDTCRGRGWTTKGATCIACAQVFMEKNNGQKVGDHYKTYYDADRRLTWTDPATGVKGALHFAKMPSGRPSGLPTAAAPSVVVAPAASIQPRPAAPDAQSEAQAAVKTDAQLVAEVAPLTDAQLVQMAGRVERVTEAIAEATGMTPKQVRQATELGQPQGLGGAALIEAAQQATRVETILTAPALPSMLFIGIMPTKLPAEMQARVIQLDAVFSDVCGQAAKIGKVDYFSQLDTWKRKDVLAVLADQWASKLVPGSILYAPMGSMDMAKFVEALRPYCPVVIEIPRAA